MKKGEHLKLDAYTGLLDVPRQLEEMRLPSTSTSFTLSPAPLGTHTHFVKKEKKNNRINRQNLIKCLKYKNSSTGSLNASIISRDEQRFFNQRLAS